MRRAASEASSRRFAHADRDVEVLADEIDEARREVDLQRDRRIRPDELREERREHDRAQVARHRHAQPSGGLDLPVLGERRRRGHVLDDVMRVLQHREPEVGDRELAGRAQQQPLAQLGFERRHPARHRRLGEPEPPGRPREAAFVDDAREEQEIVRLEFMGLRVAVGALHWPRCQPLLHGNNVIHFDGFRHVVSNKYSGLVTRHHSEGARHEHPADQFQRPSRRVAIDAPRHPDRRTPARRRSRGDA